MVVESWWHLWSEFSGLWSLFLADSDVGHPRYWQWRTWTLSTATGSSPHFFFSCLGHSFMKDLKRQLNESGDAKRADQQQIWFRHSWLAVLTRFDMFQHGFNMFQLFWHIFPYLSITHRIPGAPIDPDRWLHQAVFSTPSRAIHSSQPRSWNAGRALEVGGWRWIYGWNSWAVSMGPSCKSYIVILYFVTFMATQNWIAM
jgi:hypothetical protein